MLVEFVSIEDGEEAEQFPCFDGVPPDKHEEVVFGLRRETYIVVSRRWVINLPYPGTGCVVTIAKAR